MESNKQIISWKSLGASFYFELAVLLHEAKYIRALGHSQTKGY